MLPTAFERMSRLLEDFVQLESQDRRVAGILFFGSFVKGKVRATSDLDLLVLHRDIDEYSRTRQIKNGTYFEVHRWPLATFARPFSGRSGGAFQDAFCFEVMRNGRILYDPEGVLQRFRIYAQTHRLPLSHAEWFVQRAQRNLRLADSLLKAAELEGAELELRKAAEELARAVLLENDVLELIPPKNLVPSLRDKASGFYGTFRAVHNIEKIDVEDVEVAIHEVSHWVDRTAEEIRCQGRQDLLKLGSTVHGSRTELLNARDCLENGDIEAAVLEVRYSAMLLASFIVTMIQGSGSGSQSRTQSDRYVLLARSSHPFAETLKAIMNFSRDKTKLRKHIDALEDAAGSH